MESSTSSRIVLAIKAASASGPGSLKAYVVAFDPRLLLMFLGLEILPDSIDILLNKKRRCSYPCRFSQYSDVFVLEPGTEKVLIRGLVKGFGEHRILTSPGIRASNKCHDNNPLRRGSLYKGILFFVLCITPTADFFHFSLCQHFVQSPFERDLADFRKSFHDFRFGCFSIVHLDIHPDPL